jgi:arylesterase/paraoxonase
MKRLFIIVLILVVAIVGVYVIRMLTGLGQFTTLFAHFEGVCEAIAAPAGPEDLALDRKLGRVYVSAYDRRAAFSGEEARGGIYVLYLDIGNHELIELTADGPADFRPHGLSLYQGPNGEEALFVINHPSDGRQLVEIFDITIDGLLQHRETVEHKMMRSPNDLHAVGLKQFYATNDHANRDGMYRFFEDLLQWDATDLVYFDGDDMWVAAEGLTYANGVNGSPDGQAIYVTETTDGALRIYARDPVTGFLRERDRAMLGTGLDNIDVAPDGSLWIAAHPKILDFASHRRRSENLSPTQILKVRPGEQSGGGVEEVYLNLGDEFSAGSVATVHKNKMVVGGVMDPKILICEFDSPPNVE